MINSPLPRWQLALAVGAPVAALGIGYIYYKNSTSRISQKSVKQNEQNINGKHISLDGDLPTESLTTNETLLKEAQKYKEEGNKLFKEGKYEEAVTKYNNAITLCPEDEEEILAIFYQNRAAAYEHLNMYSSVKEDCTKALNLNPHYVKALLRRATAFEHCKEFEKSLEDLTAACFLEKFSNSRTLAIADNVLKKIGKSNADEYIVKRNPVMPSKYFIKNYFMPFHSDPIFLNLDQLSTENNSPFSKAAKAFKDNDYDNIIQLCTEEIKCSSEDSPSTRLVEAHLLRGTFYLLLGQYQNAIEDLNFVIDHQNSSIDCKVNALIKRATMHLQLQEQEKTFQDLAQAEKLNPKCSDIFHNRGQAYLMLENIDSAKDDFYRAVNLSPNNGLVYVQKCFTDFRYGATVKSPEIIERSLQDFETAFLKFPDCTECYVLYAQVLTDMQNFAKADSYYAQAMEKDPKHALAYVQRGMLQLMWDGNSDKAAEYFNKALELDDKCEIGYETLGTLEVQRGNLDKAITLFDNALDLCRTPAELAHIFGLKFAAKTQLTVRARLGEDLMRNSMTMVV